MVLATRSDVLSTRMLHMIEGLAQDWRQMDERIDKLSTEIEVLAHEELMQIAEPILRADFKLCETYEYVDDAPLDMPLSVFGGVTDSKVPESVLEPWREQTTAA